MCEACDHPLQHIIRAVIARYDAPIPRPTARQMRDELANALEEWELEQEGTYKPGHSGGFPF